MSKEFSVRVSEDLAEWVRERGSPAAVLGRAAGAAQRGLLNAEVPDPGPGPERLTVRVPAQALPRLRELTHSRSNLVSLRKLLFAGSLQRGLPAPRPTMTLATRSMPALLPPAQFLCPFCKAGGIPDVYCPHTPNRPLPLLEGAYEVYPARPSRLLTWFRALPLWFGLLLVFSPVLIILGFCLWKEFGRPLSPSIVAGPAFQPFTPASPSALAVQVWR